MRARSGSALLLLAALAAPADLAAQTTEARDSVVLTNGTQLRGRIVRIDDKELILRIGSRDRAIPRNQIRSLVSVAAEHRQLLEAWQHTDPADVAALLALAGKADSAGLPNEARLLRWYAVLQRPRDAAIHAALGNKKERDGFLVEIDGNWVPFEQADALGKDFDDAWRLRSEHFAIRCAAGLRTGLDTLMELEGLYWAMHDVFGLELGLYELVEPIDVRLYRERKQMPNLANTVGAYFAADEPALYTCVEGGRPYALMHEATHALLHWFFVRAAKTRGALPAWLDEGWADYMDGRVAVPAPGKTKLLPGSVQERHRATLADLVRSGGLLGVHRVLNLKSSDFQASTRQDAKYAQSWALFRYLRESDDATLRAGFVEYLRDAVAGQGQASTFRRIFAKYEKQLETAPWQG